MDKNKPTRPGWICQIGGVTWWIFRATKPIFGLRYVLTTDKHNHYSDHTTLAKAKEYAEQGGHQDDPNSYENRRKRPRR